MNKLTTREKRLGIKLLIDEDSSTILLKEVVDRINLEKKRGDKGFIRHEKAMTKVKSLIGLNSGFGTCPILGHVITMPNGSTKTIETYVLNRKQAITTAASLNDKILLWVMDRFEEMMMIIKEDNKVLQAFNTQRLSVVDTTKDMTNAKMEVYLDKHGKKPHFSKYIAEHTMLFNMVTGYSQSQYKKVKGLGKKDKVRDHLSTDELALLVYLERANTTLIEGEQTIEERKSTLIKNKISFERRRNRTTKEASKSLTDKQHLVVY